MLFVLDDDVGGVFRGRQKGEVAASLFLLTGCIKQVKILHKSALFQHKNFEKFSAVQAQLASSQTPSLLRRRHPFPGPTPLGDYGAYTLSLHAWCFSFQNSGSATG